MLLTGASRGLGRVLAAALAARGANLALTARSAGALEETAAGLGNDGGHVVTVPCDVSDASSCHALLDRVSEQLGPIDVLVNNAGIQHPGAFAEADLAAVERTLDTNLLGVLRLTRLVLPGMLERRQGHVVTIASLAGKQGAPYNATYSATKAGLVEWTRAVSGELDGTGVGISVVCPGFISDVGMFVDSYGKKAPRLVGESTPKDVADALVRAIEKNVLEILVNPVPVRPLLALNAVAPGAANALMRRLGVGRIFRSMRSE